MLNLQWLQNNALVSGYDYTTGQWIYDQINYGILYPASVTPGQQLILKSSAANELGQTLQNVQLYLDGSPDELEEIQFSWPLKGGGLQISFDGGVTYNTFSSIYGNKTDNTTWPILPAEAIGADATNGVLRSIDSASLLFRYVVPANCQLFEIFTLSIQISCDVI
jgi:hypothetical protein